MFFALVAAAFANQYGHGGQQHHGGNPHGAQGNVEFPQALELLEVKLLNYSAELSKLLYMLALDSQFEFRKISSHFNQKLIN